MSSRLTKASVPGKVLRQPVCDIARAAGRAPRGSLVTITIWPKATLAGCTSNDSTKRGAPSPT